MLIYLVWRVMCDAGVQVFIVKHAQHMSASTEYRHLLCATPERESGELNTALCIL
jgi:hypothetical protein